MALPERHADTALHINPSLAVHGCFTTEVDGAPQSAHLDLATHPGLAAWLLSILDHLEGGQHAPRPIAPPPGGITGQALLDAGILYLRQQPGGGVTLGLNPGFATQLMLDVRRKDQRAHNTMLSLTDDAALSRWLLQRYATPAQQPDPSRMDAALLASLQRHSVLVRDLPAAPAFFPDPAAPADLAAELATAGRTFIQEAGQAVPAEVRALLGRHTPALPSATAIIWGQDAGTGMVYPSLATGGLTADLAARVGTGAAARAAAWQAERQAARESVRTRRHAVLREIVPAAHRERLRRYVRQLHERGYFPALGDGQVALRASIHNQPTIAALHLGLAGIVNAIGEEPVVPSYCYLGCYEEGAVLDRHLDRPQCVYNLCLVLDYQYVGRDGEPDPWPIYLELDGKPEAALMRVGDGVFFSGSRIWHWRDALPAGQRAVVCFFHFVPVGFRGSLD